MRRRWDLAGGDRVAAATSLPPDATRQGGRRAEPRAARHRRHIPKTQWRRAVAVRLAAAFPEVTAALALRRRSEAAGAVDADLLALVRAYRQDAAVVLVTHATTRLAADLGLPAHLHGRVTGLRAVLC